MGKEKSIHKQIGNAIKAKGLQKLRWYCQLCQKQCRDENGFKCHQTSEGHKRQMMLFGHDPDKFVDDFSQQFENDFIDLMRRSHPNNRVHANDVYRDYIADRHHTHMNSTKWLTLTDFVKHLGKEGKCKVEETDKGWFIRLVVEDPFKHLQQGEVARKQQADAADELRRLRELQEQVERAREEAEARGDAGPTQATALNRGASDAPVKLSLGAKRPAAANPFAEAAAPRVAGFGAEEEDAGAGAPGPAGKRRRTAAEAIVEEEQRKRAAAEDRAAAAAAAAAAAEAGGRGQAWVRPGIVVKVLSKALREHGYYKKKGAVVSRAGRVAEIEMLDSGDVLRVDERELETVVPSAGGAVVVVRGDRAGARGTLLAIDEGRFQAEVELGEGPVWLDYEDFSKASAAQPPRQ